VVVHLTKEVVAEVVEVAAASEEADSAAVEEVLPEALMKVDIQKAKR
ncbi:unnamed protein product, partial [Soboliphyme baturini]|uniref:50S ribosomal protein L17 n=1 Tax=Soboliphyme baturini TaxID=241478 RepID=A0A183J913_9BILA